MRTVSGPNEMPLTASPVTNTCGTNPLRRISLTAADAACFAESDVDDHQIRAPMRSGGHCIGDIALHGADRVTETLERFRKQSPDHRVVLHDEGALRFHRTTSPPAPPSFTQAAILLSDVDATASSPNLGETLLDVVGAVLIIPGPSGLSCRAV